MIFKGTLESRKKKNQLFPLIKFFIQLITVYYGNVLTEIDKCTESRGEKKRRRANFFLHYVRKARPWRMISRMQAGKVALAKCDLPIMRTRFHRPKGSFWLLLGLHLGLRTSEKLRA